MPEISARPSRRAAIAALLALAAATAGAQQQPSPLPGVFGEVMDVRVVNLEVVVTDKQGLPILGLGPSDFRLVVDGEEVPVDYFSEVRGGVAVAGGEAGGEKVAGVPALAPGERVGTSYLVFIDEFFSLPPDRDRVLAGLREDLPLLQPEDRMAIVAFDGDRLEMLTSWESSVERLERVLRDATLRPAKGLQRLSERRQYAVDDALLQYILAGDESFSPYNIRTRLSSQERAYLRLASEQLDRSVAAAAATLRSFAMPPGRKVMLLLSGGWPFVPAELLDNNFERVVLDREGLEGEQLYRRLSDTANLLGYTLYPIDVPGIERLLVDTSVATLRDPGLPDGSIIREQERHFTLRYLARETGGKALVNSLRERAFQRVVSDTRSYYWLGFSPDRAWDDERHQVEVRLVDPTYRVRTRSGFLDTSKQREVTMQVESALLFGNSGLESGLEVKAGEPHKAGRGRMEVPLEVRIPLQELTFLPAAGGYAAQVELRVAVVDERGSRAQIPIIPMLLTLEQPPVAGQVGRYETSLRLRRLRHDAVVAVYDPASGRILSAGLTMNP